MNLSGTLNHLAIIPDGNRRWAKARLLLPWKGHLEGVKRFWELAEAAQEMGIKHLTFWGGSYSNLERRSEEEVDVLFRIMAQELAKPELLQKLAAKQTSLKVIGEWESFARNGQLKQTLQEVEDKTSSNAAHHLTILFGYDGQREMLAAIQHLQAHGGEITQARVQESLWTRDLPEVDLVIRTGGEPHWSAGFLMWQTANSQFYFTEDLWPDFKVTQLKTALEDFDRRERRLGK